MQLLDTFNALNPGSDHFNLRLIELVAVACHQIGAYLFSLEPGNHSKQLHEDWVVKARNKSPEEQQHILYVNIPPCVFFHSAFQDHERYPRGKADVAGYWAEGRIFGGRCRGPELQVTTLQSSLSSSWRSRRQSHSAADSIVGQAPCRAGTGRRRQSQDNKAGSKRDRVAQSRYSWDYASQDGRMGDAAE